MKKKNVNLAAMIQSRRLEKENYLKSWDKVAKPEDVTQAEIDYWLLFIVNNYHANLSRRNYYINGWNVRGKILAAKEAGKWPREPECNHHFLPMFRKAYNFPP